MKIAIQGHSTRGKEVIQILESLGGKSRGDLTGRRFSQYYFVNCYGVIDLDLKINLLHHKLYTLEEFEKEFPFKIGDKVKYISSIGIIKEYCYINNEPAYKVKSTELGIIVTMPVKILKPYKEMERNITLTLDKAQEWYKKGGELKEIALQAYSEEELNSLPKSWKEFCKKYPKTDQEAYIGVMSAVYAFAGTKRGRNSDTDRNICPSQKSAEAHLALIQLEQLRDCWRQGWELTTHEAVYAIKFSVHGLGVYNFVSREFLSFPTKEMAEEFLKCFRDLIEKAGDLI